MQRTYEKYIVSQDNRLVEARYHLKVREHRLVLMMISLISPNDKDFKQYEIRIKDIADLLEPKNKNIYHVVSTILDSLIGRVLHIPKPNGYLKISWLSSAEYRGDEGIISLSFDPRLKPYLLDLKGRFTQFQLMSIVRLRSIYSIRIYQLLKQYKKIGKRSFELFQLREMLGIEEIKYKRFSDFRKWVLNQAKKELEKKDEKSQLYKSDLGFDFITKRTGRKISHLTFIIKQQQTEATSKAIPITTQPKKENTPISHPHENNPNYQALIALGIQQKKAISLIEEYGENKVEEKLSILKTTQNQKKIKNPAGFLMMALQQNYLSPEMLEKRKAEVRKQKEQLAREQKARFEAAVEQNSLNYLQTHSNKQKNEVRNAFQASAFYQKQFGDDLMLDYLYSETETLEEAFAISDFKEYLQAFIIWHYVPNAEHLRNLTAWKGWEEKQEI